MSRASTRRAPPGRGGRLPEDRGGTMATIRASCAECGDVELTTADVTVRVCTGDNGGAYTFRCPSCRMIVVKQADPPPTALPVASGGALPPGAPRGELPERQAGPPLSHD